MPSISLPRRSRAIIFEAPGVPLRTEALPVPSPGRQEVLVRNEYVTLCRSDLNTYSGKRDEATPTILGHEIVGRIAAFGPEAPDRDERGVSLALGDRITWSIFASDPDSRHSCAGIPQKGDDLLKYGHERLRDDHTLHGGLSEYCLLRPHTVLVKLDETVPLSVAALINCAGATVAGSLRLAGPLHGRTVAISGVGMLGTIACAMAREAGAVDIVALDITPDRLKTARRFGATETLLASDSGPARTSLPQVQVFLDYSGAAEAMRTSLDVLDIGGVTVWVGGTFPQPTLGIDPERIIRRLYTIRGLHNYNRGDLVRAVDFFEQHHATYPFDELVYDGFTLDEAEAAFTYALDAAAHRVGLTLTGSPDA